MLMRKLWLERQRTSLKLRGRVWRLRMLESGSMSFCRIQRTGWSSIVQFLTIGRVLISNSLALSALSSGDIRSILTSRATGIQDQQIFNVKIPFEGAPITNQRSSGRCWLFASTNVFRVALMKRHNLDKFELSQAYLFFYDKLEKANFFLEQILDTVDEDLDSTYISLGVLRWM